MSYSFATKKSLVIVGAACRFPGSAYTLDSFYSILRKGQDAVTAIPEDRFSSDRFFSASHSIAGHSYTKAAGIIPNLFHFDPSFFGISRTEAQDMDPQQRLVLEMTWEALENAGIPPSLLRGSKAGVYMGVAGIDTALRNTDDIVAGSPYTMTGSTLSIVSNRVSHFFDLHGPSLSVDTACSSSLVALHIACEALRFGEIPFAVVGGVNCLLAPFAFSGFSKAHMLSPDGRCKSFDADGNGYVRSEGGGVVLITTAREAEKNGWEPLAVIAGSGVNSDGRTTGIALPNSEAQASLIHDVYKRFSLDRNKLAYVEAHGTGTSAGDPLEANAIGKELGKPLLDKRLLCVGSVKTNIGHLETAAGMAGLIKSLLVLKNREIPATLHFTKPNPAIDFSGCNIHIPTTITALPDLGGEELVSINSFGFGGTNAHVVLQRVTNKKKVQKKEQQEVLPLFLSARSAESLKKYAFQISTDLDTKKDISSTDVAYSLALKREHLDRRAIVTGDSLELIQNNLKALSQDNTAGNVRIITEDTGLKKSGVFVFSGNGSQWLGMGRSLMQDEIFYSSLQKVNNILQPLQGWSLLDVLRDPESFPDAFSQTEKSQPLIFAMQVSIVEYLTSKGIKPAAVMGHSVGEVAAAWCAGALTLEDAALVIHVRSHLQAPLHGTGAMAAANMDVSTAKKVLKPFGNDVEIAAVNTDKSLSLAGDIEKLRQVVGICKKQRIAAKMLDIPYPFHTHFMEFIDESMGGALNSINPQKAEIPFFSTVTGKLLRSFVPNAEYWQRNVRKTVLFAPALNAAYKKGFRFFMEIGPSPVLRSYMRDIFKQKEEATFITSAMNKNGNSKVDLEDAWKNAWVNGWKLDIKTLFPNKNASFTTLPTYPWNHEYCWREETSESRCYITQKRVHPTLGWRVHGNANFFENTIHTTDFSWINDHVAGQQTLFPAAAFIESILAAGKQIYPEQSITIERLSLLQPLIFTSENAKSTRIGIDKEDGAITIEGRTFNSAEAWILHAKGRIIASDAIIQKIPLLAVDTIKKFGVRIDCCKIYEAAERSKLSYGESFQVVKKAWLKHNKEFPEVLAELSPRSLTQFEEMIIPPNLLDGAFHALFPLLDALDVQSKSTYLPAFFEKISLINHGTPQFVHAQLKKLSPRSIVADFLLYDSQGNLLVILQGCRFRRAFWLEQETPPSAPYQIGYVAVSHPKDVIIPKGISLKKMVSGAKKSFNAVKESKGKDNIHYSWLLLQLASLSSAYEAISNLLPDNDGHIPFSFESLFETSEISSEYKLWIRFLLGRLYSSGMALYENNVWTLLPQKKQQKATLVWRTLLSTSPEKVYEANLVSHIHTLCSSIFRGKFLERESEILSYSLEQAYFANATILQRAALGVKQALKAAIEATHSGEEFRILLMGKQSEIFLSQLEPYLIKSCCHITIVTENESQAEVGNLQYSHIQGIDFIPLSADCYESGRDNYYHCIVSAWSLHEHLNFSICLSNLKKMLVNEGIFILLEQSPNDFCNFVFGSRRSWWEASMSPEQPVSLLQTKEAWEKNLDEAGFTHITSVGESSEPAFILFATHEQKELQEFSETNEKDIHPYPWTIISQEQGTVSAFLGKELEKTLHKKGINTVYLYQGKNGDILFDSLSEHSWSKVLQPKKSKPEQIIYIGAYDDKDRVSSHTLEQTMLHGISSLTALSKASKIFGKESKLFVISGGAFGGDLLGERPVPSQGSILGFTRVLSNELRTVETKLIDIHQLNKNTPNLIVQEILYPTNEPEVILTAQGRFIPRLKKYKEIGEINKETSSVSLCFDQPGPLKNLYWKESEVREPRGEEVRIIVSHTGLNFRDVMWSMGLLPDEALENGFSGAGLGIECSGIIDAVGEKVVDLAVGDEVLCFASSCFSKHVITLSSTVTKKPETLSFAEAATVPVAFITAWYSLRHLARLERGQSVLIHGAAGGVGLAAIQIAAHLGLEIYATAGAAEKHHYLRRLGIKNIYSSRSLTFVQDVLDATNGKGVDCVLNSLAGEFASAGISILKPFGHFIELGKRDFFADSPMRLRPFSNNLTYYGVDVDQLIIHNPQLANKLFKELMDLFSERKLRPISYSVYPAVRVVDAFQSMQQSNHIGKIVVSLDSVDDIATPAAEKNNTVWYANPDGTYIVTGGNSGLGFASARFLVKSGAKNILLISRRGTVGEEEVRELLEHRKKGINIIDVLADVTKIEELRSALNKTLADFPPVKGVIHAATTLDDGVIDSLSPERLKNAFSAKAIGAWNLHDVTSNTPLDFFVLFSSATTVFGNPGQAGYVAANSMLETLASWRHSKGLAADVIGWGAIGDTGILTRNPKAKQVLLQRLGITPTSSAEAIQWLEHTLSKSITHSYYFSLNWQSRADLSFLSSPRFSLLRANSAKSGSKEGSSLETIRNASVEEGIKIVTTDIQREVANILRLPVDKIPTDAPLASQGMDSLMAVELSMAIEQKFALTGYTLPLTDKTTIRNLATPIHTLIMTGSTTDVEDDTLVDQVTQKHGAHLTEELHESVLDVLNGGKNASR